MTFLSNTAPRTFLRTLFGNLPIAITALSFLMSPMIAFAIDVNRDLPIAIESDRAEIDDSTGISSYSGNVVISQGSTTLKADTITVIAQERVLTKIVAIGQPASFEQKDTASEQGTSGQADQITYISKDSILLFEGQAKLAQQTNSFAGERIEYDIMRKAIKAKGDEDTGQRVKIQYFPGHPTTDNTSTAPASSQTSSQPDLNQE